MKKFLFLAGLAWLVPSLAAAGGPRPAAKTTTIYLASGGDLYTSSAQFQAIDGATFFLPKGQFIIQSMQAFAMFPSTVADIQLAVRKTTETGATSIAHVNVNTSSFTVPVNQRYGSVVTPDNLTVLNAGESLALWVITCPSSGTLPGNWWGVAITGFKTQ